MNLFGKLQELTGIVFRTTGDAKTVEIKAISSLSGASSIFTLPNETTGEILTDSGTQILSNKTASALLISNYLQVSEVAAASVPTPAAGVNSLFFETADGKLYFKDEAGAATKVGGDVVDDTSPQLGGNLDTNGNDIISADNSAADTSPTNPIELITGTKTVGTGDSGSILFQTGSATGNQGGISFKDGTEGTAGHVWVSSDTAGLGGWAVSPASTLQEAFDADNAPTFATHISTTSASGDDPITFQGVGHETLKLVHPGQDHLVFADDPSSGFTVTIGSNNISMAASYALTLPLDAGSAGEFLQTNGSGVLTWDSVPATTLQAAYDGGKTIATGLGGSDYISITTGSTALGESFRVRNFGTSGSANAARFIANAGVAMRATSASYGTLIDVSGSDPAIQASSSGTGSGLKVERTSTTGANPVVDINNESATAPHLRFTAKTAGTIDILIPASSTSHVLTLPSAQGGAGTQLQNDGSGNLSWTDQVVVESFNDAGRPAAGTAGRVIFNTDDATLNVDDGTNWRDMAGVIT
jgi:hypothetical protein